MGVTSVILSNLPVLCEKCQNLIFYTNPIETAVKKIISMIFSKESLLYYNQFVNRYNRKLLGAELRVISQSFGPTSLSLYLRYSNLKLNMLYHRYWALFVYVYSKLYYQYWYIWRDRYNPSFIYIRGAYDKFPDFFRMGIYNFCRPLKIHYIIVIHLIRWLANSYDFMFKWTATVAIGIHPIKAWLSQLVNFKNAIWTWGHFRRTICNEILF